MPALGFLSPEHDYQPFSIKDLLTYLEPRYTKTSRRYFTETVIPKIHEKVKQSVVQELTNATYVSFTTDIWNTELKLMLYLVWKMSPSDKLIDREDTNNSRKLLLARDNIVYMSLLQEAWPIQEEL